MLKVFLIVLLGMSSAFGGSEKSTSCPDWEGNFQQRKRNIENSFEEIDAWFKTKFGRDLPACEGKASVSPTPGVGTKTARISAITITDMPGFAGLATKLPEFKYVVLPPKVPQSDPKTVVVFAGGPGNVLSTNPERERLDHYQVLFADYIGRACPSLS